MGPNLIIEGQQYNNMAVFLAADAVRSEFEF